MSLIRRIVYAPNVHQGGGKTLLLSLLSNLENRDDTLYFLDKRLTLPDDWKPEGELVTVKSSIFSRFFMELCLWMKIKPESQLLCMGNLPPLFACNGKVTVFVQNCYVVNKESLEGFPFFNRSRIRCERLWLRLLAPNVNRFIVQTESMAMLLKETLNRAAVVLPFVDLTPVNSTRTKANLAEKKFDFIYVASGEPHKNHEQLLLAWINLAKLNYFPRLCLTVDKNHFSGLCEWIDACVRQHHLNVEVVSNLSLEEVQVLYKISKALIYPSKSESFGLPLIEAISMGLPVLASDLSYVYDVINPSMVFDPLSSESIASSVMNFSNNNASFSVKLYTSQEFLNEVFESGRRH